MLFHRWGADFEKARLRTSFLLSVWPAVLLEADGRPQASRDNKAE